VLLLLLRAAQKASSDQKLLISQRQTASTTCQVGRALNLKQNAAVHCMCWQLRQHYMPDPDPDHQVLAEIWWLLIHMLLRYNGTHCIAGMTCHVMSTY
jgi:hypothetical protein